MNDLRESDLKVVFNQEQIQSAIQDLGRQLNELYGEEEVYFVSVLKGSVMFAVDLAKQLRMPIKMEFIRLSSYGSGTVSSGNVHAVDISLPNLNEKNVLIVEDIIDTGYTAKFLIDFINQNFKVKTLKFCALLDKKIRREVDINADFYCFEVDDKFLVGYGLDYDGYLRNIPYIGYLNEE